MSRYTVTEQDGSYRIEDNEAEQDTPARILDVSFTTQHEARDHALQLNRKEEQRD